MSTIKILHVEGDPLIRNLFSSQFNASERALHTVEGDDSHDDLQIVKSVGTGEDAVKACKENEFDLVLMEIDLPGITGYETAQQLLILNPDLHIIFFSSYTSLDNINAGIKIGVNGYLSKENSIDTLKHAIRIVLSGTPYFKGNAQMKILQENLKKGNGSLLSELELKLLQLVYQDNTRKEIAGKLNYSMRSIDLFIIALKEKLGLKSTIDLVLYAERNRLF